MDIRDRVITGAGRGRALAARMASEGCPQDVDTQMLQQMGPFGQATRPRTARLNPRLPDGTDTELTKGRTDEYRWCIGHRHRWRIGFG